MGVFAAMGNLYLLPFYSLEDPIAISLPEDMYDKMRMEVEKWKKRTIWVVFNSNFRKRVVDSFTNRVDMEFWVIGIYGFSTAFKLARRKVVVAIWLAFYWLVGDRLTASCS
ncbi:hypothetical protein Csa_004804 [Cucumis sativus]|uniref:Uncharacterized protein n=1 Tax=Cucumis sativus TaxID=3659 RepID=A0A0A0K8K0_CUCSA|nr:hypothetical protein Csa_004804 [Cucumis sativus]